MTSLTESVSVTIMEKLIICVVLIAVVSAHKLPRTIFNKGSEDNEIHSLQRVSCTNANRDERDKIIEESQCGTPKDQFVYLETKAHEQMNPRAVWVKRCVGLCDYDKEGSCVATKTVIRHIPIRIYNSKTDKETCAMYPIEEHASCGCCALSPDQCASPRIYNPRKCGCQCPNMEERRNCLKKRNSNMRWNRSKCACEERRRVP